MIAFLASHGILAGAALALTAAICFGILLEYKSNHILVNMISGALLFSGLALIGLLIWASLHELTDSELLALKEAGVLDECTLNLTIKDTTRRYVNHPRMELLLSYTTVYQNHALCKEIQHENDSKKKRAEKLRKLKD